MFPTCFEKSSPLLAGAAMFTTRQLLGRSDVLKRLASHPRFAPCHGKSEWDPGQTGDMAMENGSFIIFYVEI
jgi:hypothetical protein